MRSLCLMALCLAFASAAPVAEETVTTDLLGHGITADMELPEAFVANIMTPEGEHVLRLVRNEKMHKSKRATLHVDNTETDVKKRDVSYYHGTGGESAYVALERRDGQLRMSGLMFKRGNLYEISPAQLETTKRSVDEHLHIVKKSADDVLEPYRRKVETSIRALPKVEFAEQQMPEAPEVVPKTARDTDTADVPALGEPETEDTCTPKLYTVELLFLMDFTMYNYYVQRPELVMKGSSPEEELHYRAEQILNTMDGIYEDSFADTCTRFELKLMDVQCATTKEQAWYVEDHIIDQDKPVDDMHPEKAHSDANKILDSIGKWLQKHGLSYHNPDHCMAFTKYDILGTGLKPSCVGLAPVYGVCRPTMANISIGVSVIEMQSPHSDIACAHELGHNVGSPHDGQKGSGQSCNGTLGNVMGPTVNRPTEITTPNMYLFSPCSKASISATLLGQLDGYPRNCLVEQICTYAHTIDPATALGEMGDMDLQCDELTGSKDFKSFDISRLTNPTGDFCELMVCHKESTGEFKYQTSYWPERGTACGTNMKCIKGKCRASSEYQQVYHMMDNAKVQCTTAAAGGCAQEKNWRINIQDEVDGVKVTVDTLDGCKDIADRRPDICFNEKYKTDCCQHCTTNWLAFD